MNLVSSLITINIGQLSSKSLLVGSQSHLTHNSLNYPYPLRFINTRSCPQLRGGEEQQSYVVELIPWPNPSKSNCGASWSYQRQGVSLVKECLNTKAHGCKLFHLFSNAKLIYFPHVCCVNLTYMLLDSLVTNMDMQMFFWQL